MGAFNSAIITKKGLALLTKAVANKVKLEFTQIKTSENALSGDLASRADIGTIKQAEKVASIVRQNEYSVKVSTSFTNKGLTAGYYIRNIGLYALDSQEGEILYSISVADESVATADYMPPPNGVSVNSLMVDLITAVSNASKVNLTVDPTATATVAQIMEVHEHLTALDNSITTTTEKTLGGSVAGGLKINKISGISRKCSNLIAPNSVTVNGYTCTIQADGSMLVSGTATDPTKDTVIPLNSNIPVLEVNKTYSLFITKNGSSVNTGVGVKTIYTDAEGGAVWGNLGDATRRRQVELVYLQFIPETAGLTNCNGEYKIWINEETALPYEPYFEGLRSVEMSEITACGKNLVKCAYFPTANNYDSLVKMEKVSNVIKGHTYTISVDLEASQATQAYWNANSFIYNFKYFEVLAGKHRYSYTFTALNDANLVKKLLLSKDNKSDGITITPSNCQIEEGTVATEYEPYKESSITLSQPITVHGIPVSSGGNYTDKNGQAWLCDEFDEENGKIIQRVGCADMGTLVWDYGSFGKSKTFNTTILDAEDNANGSSFGEILTPSYQVVSPNAMYDDTQNNAICLNRNVIRVASSDHTDVANFKNAVSGVMLYYALATPIITDISSTIPVADQIALYSLRSHDGVTYILTDSKETPHIEVEYGTNKTGAHILDSLLTVRRNELKLSELTTAVLALN